jgi:hypothetical protein
MDNNQLQYYAGETSLKDELIENNTETLREHFIGLSEYNDEAITDKNMSRLFSLWLENLDIFDLTEIVEPF